MKRSTLTLFISLFVSLSQLHAQSLDWVVNMGGTDTARPEDLAVDSEGSIYTSGMFEGTIDFDPGPGVFNLTASGDMDIYIAKVDVNGNFMWAYQFGSSGNDTQEWGRSVAVDNDDNVYMVGYFHGSIDFDPGAGETILSAGNHEDGFLLKLDSSGVFLWALEFGSSGDDRTHDVAVDQAGNVFVCGGYDETVTFPGNGPTLSSAANTYDVFVCKFDSEGNNLWTHSAGGNDSDTALSLAVDDDGNVYYNCWFYGETDLVTSEGPVSFVCAGNADTYVGKLNSDGDFLWAKHFGGLEEDWMFSITIHPNGNPCITGRFRQTVDFDPGENIHNVTASGASDVAVFMLDTNGGLVWVKQIGSTNGDSARCITTDDEGNIYIAGFFNEEVDFDPGEGVHMLTSYGSADAFILQLHPDGSFGWVASTGGTSYDESRSVEWIDEGKIYSAGTFQNLVDFEPGIDVHELTAFQNDLFIMKISPPIIEEIQEFFPGIDMLVYPNPAHSVVSIQLGKTYTDVSLSVRDQLGKVIFNRFYPSFQQQQLEMNVNAGIYFVEVVTSSGMEVKRLAVR